MKEIDNVIKKFVHLIQYPRKKTIFRKIKFILDIENWQQKVKFAAFLPISIKRSDIKKPFDDVHLDAQPIESHLPHYEILQLSSP